MKRVKSQNLKLPKIIKNIEQRSIYFDQKSAITKNNSTKDITLQSIIHNQLLQIKPREIIFTNSHPGQLYQTQIIVRNTTKHGRKLRILPPNNKAFKITSNYNGILAPGLSITITLNFECTTNQKVISTIMIETDIGYNYSIRVQGNPPLPLIIFQPFLNFGFVKTGCIKKDVIQIKNEGQIKGQILLTPQLQLKEYLSIDPEKLIINAKQKQLVEVTFKAINPGLVRGKILVSGQNIFLNEIQIISTSLQFNRLLLNNQGKEINRLNFGVSFFGQVKVMKASIVNNTPKKSNFRIQFRQKQQQNQQFRTPAQMGYQQMNRCINCNPFYGQILPYQYKEVIFQWTSNILPQYYRLFQKMIFNQDEPMENINKVCQYVGYIRYDDSDLQYTKFFINGKFTIPLIHLSCLSFSFNNLLIYNKQGLPLFITNKSQKQIKISFKLIPNFKVNPSSIVINKNGILVLSETKQMEVEFCPKSIGQFSGLIYLKIMKFKLGLRVMGVGFQSKNSISFQRLLDQICQKSSNVEFTKHQSMSISVDKQKKNNSYIDQVRLKKQQFLRQKFFKQKYESLKSAHHFKQDLPPIDYQFEVGADTQISQMKLMQYKKKNTLYRFDKRNQIRIMSQSIIFDSKLKSPYLCLSPKNQHQKRIIKEQLTNEQLKKISVGPTIINFQTVFINSNQSRYFHIYNFTQQTISVNAYSQFQQINVINKSQIIEDMKNCSIEIRLRPRLIGSFKGFLNYILNSIHFFRIQIQAFVTPVKLILSQTDLKFIFEQDSASFIKVQQITIKNNGNSQGQYRWINNGDIFQVQPSKGVVQPGQTIKTKISYIPKQITQYSHNLTHVDEQKLRLQIDQGKQIYVKCTGIVLQGKIAIKNSIIQLGQIIIGQQKNKSFTIKNCSRYSVAYKVMHQIEGITIEPSKGIISPEGFKDLNVKIKKFQLGVIQHSVIILVRSGKSFQITLKGQVLYPKMNYNKQVIDFGRQTIQGNPSYQIVTLSNNSNCGVRLTIKQNVDQQDRFFMDNLCLWFQRDEDNLKHLTYQKYKPQYHQSLQLQLQNVKVQNLVELRQNEVIQIGPFASVKFVISFIPKQQLQYKFNLPIKLKNNLNKQYIELDLKILCEGIKPLFQVQPQIIFFKNVTILDQQNYTPKLSVIKLINPSYQKIFWRVNYNEQQLYPFKFQIKEGQIQPYSFMTTNIFFDQMLPGHYQKEVSFFIKSQQIVKQEKKYLKLKIIGQAQYPFISFDCRQIILPVVPLKIESRKNFTIFNRGYDNINLQYRIIQQMTNIDIYLQFPQSSHMGISKKSIPVIAVFRSLVPINFTLIIEFSDNMNRVYKIPISGTADNCTFTNYPFYQNIQKYKFKIEVGQNAIPFIEQSKQLMFDSAGQISQHLQKNIIRQQEIQILISFVNKIICKKTVIQIFPQSLQQQYSCFMAILQKVSIASYKAGKPFINSVKVNSKLSFYSQIIKVLKIQGCFLNHIRPQYLLSYLQYQLYQKDFKDQIIITKKMQESRSWQSWQILLNQIIKVYYLNKINLKYFHSIGIPLLQKKYHVFSSQFSNFISTSEEIIICWLKLCWKIQNQEIESSYDFIKRFKNYEFSYQAINLYVNSLVKMIRKKQSKTYFERLSQKMNFLKITNFINFQWSKYIDFKQAFLLNLYLMMILPNFIPKSAPIIFSCQLGQSISKSIQITNNFNYQLIYQARIENDPDFQLEHDYIKINPNQIFFLVVKYNSRISQVNNSSLILTGVQGFNIPPVVFRLQPNITGRYSTKIFSISTALYETYEFQIEVQNPFKQAGDFHIKIEQLIFTDLIVSKKKLKKSIQKKIQTVQKQVSIPSIICKSDLVAIKNKEKKYIKFINLPCVLQKTKSYFRLIDNRVGQIQYQIISDPSLPNQWPQIIKIPQTIYVNTTSTYEYVMTSINSVASKALKQLESFINQRKKKYANFQIQPNQKYTVQLINSSNFINVKYPLTTKQEQLEEGREKKSDSQEKKLKFTFNFKDPIKDYSNVVVVKNTDLTDVRCYKIQFNIYPKIQKIYLQMNCQQGKSIVQNIPLINSGDKQWIFKINIIQEYFKNFLIPQQKQITVNPKNIYNYPITFKPRAIGKFQSKINIFNSNTFEVFQINVTGISLMPAASEVIECKCQIGKTLSIPIKINNSKSTPVSYKVSIQLEKAEGPYVMNIQPYSTKTYTLTMMPNHMGKYTGNITFMQQDGKYIWYSIIVTTQNLISKGSIQLKSQQRQLITHKLKIKNELNQPTTYNVIFDNQYIFGQKQFKVDANSESKYSLNYLPFIEGQYQGKITFVNQKLQFFYQLKMICQKNNPIKIPQFKTQLGIQQKEQIQLFNPSNSYVQINQNQLKSCNFYIDKDKIVIPPNSNLKLNICFSPSKLDHDFGQIQLNSKKIGSWLFLVSGVTSHPTISKELIMVGTIKQQITEYLIFKNPFNEKILVTTQLQEEKCKNVFALVEKSSKHQLLPKQSIQLGIIFKPKLMLTFRCYIYISLNEKIKWTYPVIGITEFYNDKLFRVIKTKCRNVKQQQIQLQLNQIKQDSIDQTQWKIQLHKIPQENINFVKNFVTINKKKDKLKSIDDHLIFTIIFKPYRSFRTELFIKISKQQGCIWYYKIYLQATNPDFDDKIIIQSNLHKISSISFRLTNKNKFQAPFQAYFDIQSGILMLQDSEFLVTPRQGILMAYGKEGTQIIISFSPNEYRKSYKATLIVQTEQMMWVYQIKGILPKYIPPNINKIKSHLKMKK